MVSMQNLMRLLYRRGFTPIIGTLAAGTVLAAGLNGAFAQSRPAAPGQVALSGQSNYPATHVACSSGHPNVADQSAIIWVDQNQAGSGQAAILKTEADVDHGVCVFDIRVAAPNGTVWVVHVKRLSNPAAEVPLWETKTENQTPPTGNGNSTGGTTSTTGAQPGGNTTSHSSSSGSNQASPPEASQPPEKAQAPEASQPPENPESPEKAQAPEKSGNSLDRSTPSTTLTAPQASAVSAATVAEQEVKNQSGVKSESLHSSGGKLYYTVKLLLAPSGTTDVWVDVSTSTPTVTAIQGNGYSYRDANIVSFSTADASALAAAGSGSTVTSTKLHGGKWRFYEIKVRTSTTKYKVWVSAVTGAVTQVKAG